MPAVATRRPHTKSRLGCTQCKARKVKCDQAAPSCSACVRRKEVCSLTEVHLHLAKSNNNSVKASPLQSSPHSTRNPSPPDPDIPLPHSQDFSTVDLELTHFYATRTWSTLMMRPLAAALWKDDIFDLALEEPVLLDALLTTAAMHKLALDPESPKSSTYIEVIKRKGAPLVPYILSMLRSPSEVNCVQLFASSIVCTVWAFAFVHLPSSANLFASPSLTASASSPLDFGRTGNENRIHMPKLHDLLSVLNISLGTRAVAMDMRLEVQKRGFGALLAAPDYTNMPPTPPDVVVALDTLKAHIEATGLPSQQLQIYREQISRLHELFRVAQCPEWHDMLVGFVIRFNKEMINQLAQRQSCALVILACWTVVLKAVDGVCWWLRKWPEELFREIEEVLEAEWRAHLLVFRRFII